MGLSGRKAKQRIGKDPRNLSWADDASRFGQAYLAKFGWDASKGLGASGEGRTSAVKATQKLDMLGIGMRQQSDLEGGIAWRQNRDFEDLLRRLNDGTTTETTGTTDSTELLGSFHKAREHESEALENVTAKDDDSDGDGEEKEREGVLMAKKEKKKKKKKRKAATTEEEVEEGDGLDRKGRKKRRKKSLMKDDDDDDDGRASVSNSIESEPPPPQPSSREAPPREESGSVPMGTVTATATRPTAVTAPVPVRAPYVAMHTPLREPKETNAQHIYRLSTALRFSPRTHRARIIAAKRMAASNSTALAEILGIPSSSSSSAHPSAVASPLPDPTFVIATAAAAATTTTTTTTTTRTAATSSNTTATSSEAKDLLQNLTTSSQSVGDYFKAKLNAKAHGERQQARRPTLASPTRGEADGDGRAGLGLGFGKGASRIPFNGLDEDSEPVRGGIGSSSSSMFATMFMPRQPTPTNVREENTATAGVEIAVSHDDDNPERSEKMRAKEERRRKKEERRRKRAEAVQVDMPVDGAGSEKKHREPEAPDGRLVEDSHPSSADGREAIATKKRKKDKKSSKHRRLEE